MNIIAPINNYDEIEILHQAGVNEFYGGYTPLFWRKKYSPWISVNGRTFAESNIDSLRNLHKIIEWCNDQNITFNLTVNAPLYSEAQYPLILKLIDEYINLGGKDLIVVDLGLILLLKEKKYPVCLHLGTGSSVLNHLSVGFYENIGIKRIILDRQLSINEIKKILKNYPEIKFDVFMLVGQCPNIEGLCTFLHDSPDRNWHCIEKFKIEPIEIREKNECYNIWSNVKRTDACGLCQVKKLLELKINGFKIVGRGASLDRRLKAVRGLKRMIDICSEPNIKESKIKIQAQQIYHEIFEHSCSEMICYFS
ncbi:MAG: U32 family peptidase [Candidatus Firestonebacteria bacterium]|nr:U32 family peptidase [Candidatus Firestonebacteria bacterium]